MSIAKRAAALGYTDRQLGWDRPRPAVDRDPVSDGPDDGRPAKIEPAAPPTKTRPVQATLSFGE